MNYDGPRRRLVLAPVAEIEADGQLEVELDGRALELAAQRVVDRDVNLGPVEGALARIQPPLFPCARRRTDTSQSGTLSANQQAAALSE